MPRGVRETSYLGLLLDGAITGAVIETRSTISAADRQRLMQFAAVALRRLHIEEEYRAVAASVADLPPELVAAVEQTLAARLHTSRPDLSQIGRKSS